MTHSRGRNDPLVKPHAYRDSLRLTASHPKVGKPQEDTMMHDAARSSRPRRLGAILAVLVGVLAIGGLAEAAETQTSFGTPEAAAETLVTAFKNNDDNTLVALFGAEYAGRLLAKDKVAARADRERLYQAAQQKLILRKDTADRVILLFGPDAWPFPISLVRSGADWRFHTAEGLEEIVNRRVGANELNVIAACRAYLWAQREYASKIRDASGVRKFAQRVISSPGKQDGLYWDPATAGGEESPFGPRVAEALRSGRKFGEPYYGYYFRVLTRQGGNTTGGRYSYVINGNMIAGFALVAFPAEYGNTGVMTFLVSHHGTVYQKDLGPRAGAIVKTMQEYNPDATWTEVQ